FRFCFHVHTSFKTDWTRTKNATAPGRSNARLSGEQRYHNTQLLHRKYKSQFKLKPPNVANPS
ncbi:TPA: hypothetical protein ACJEVI_006527, partial [Pseudomonas aeruginosa]